MGRGSGAESVDMEDSIGTQTHFKEGEARTLEPSITEGQTESPDWSWVSAIRRICGNHRGATERGHGPDEALRPCHHSDVLHLTKCQKHGGLLG